MTVMRKVIRKMRKYRVNGKYKDRLFRMIFQDKRDLLDLYNAINDTEYTNPEDLEITTLEDVVYLGMKNDLGFLIGWYLNLYEHQSTWNPNMPLRGFFYFADMLRAYVELNDLNIYSSRRVMLPTPKYIIFYNGTLEQPDQLQLRLSDSFMEKESEPALECCAVMLNINYGHNRELMEKCRKLGEYSLFVHWVRVFFQKGTYSLEQAIDAAVDYCIEHEILTDILRKNRGEVKDMLLTIEDDKRHWRLMKQEVREQALAEGLAEGKETINELNKRLLEEGRISDLQRAIQDPDFQNLLLEEYGLL